MLLKKQELLTCLYARGYENIMCFEELQPDKDEQTRQNFKACLMEQKLLEQDPQNQEGYRFSAVAQVILDTIGKPDVWLEVIHLKKGIRRGLFLRDAFYVCVEEMEENVTIDLLPSLPIFIGGYASLLKDIRGNDTGKTEPVSWGHSIQLVKVCIYGSGEKLMMEIDEHGVTRETGAEGVAFSQHSQESCTNAITMWVLNALRKMKENAI